MKILKYILFALVLFGLWVTEPIWRNLDTSSSSVDEYNNTPTSVVDEYDTSLSNVDEDIVQPEQSYDQPEQTFDNVVNTVVSSESRFLKELELKIGPRPSVNESTGVPSLVYNHWRKTLEYPDSLQEETCSPIRGTEEGWKTVCRYRAKKNFDTLELREDRFLIKNGTVYKK